MSNLKTWNQINFSLIIFVAALLASRCWADHEWKLLENDSEALVSRLELVRTAQKEVCLAYFTIDSGQVVEALLKELVARAAEGVNVKLLLDGLPSRPAIERLRGCLDCGIEIRIFSPLKLGKLETLNRRFHLKLMLADNHIGIIGSRNLTDRHFGLSTSNFADCDVLIEGSICEEMQEHFDHIWRSSTVVPLEQVRPKMHLRNSRDFDVRRKLKPSGPYHHPAESPDGEPAFRAANVAKMENASGGNVSHGISADESLSLWFDRDFRKTDRTLARQVELLIDSAQHEVRIETPYPAFSREFSACLRRAANRGVLVSIQTNSISSTDKIVTHAAYMNQKSHWLSLGVQLFEYKGPDHLHSKTMIIDNAIAWIGSYNFDARSERLNLELVLQIEDPKLVTALSESMSRRQAASTPVFNVGGSNIRSASLSERAKLRLFQTLMPVLRPFL